ncbi:MAG: pyridoxal-phosphate dependent enzyme [Candidatus Latescibacteria bacterium]|nr:pyridoxal-phosphate dependent enzyme [Candidatus Latescibacterota bacterium]
MEKQFDIAAAREAITGIAVQTPVVGSQALSEKCGAGISLKLENLQVTGSFKVRGAANMILSLSDEERSGGVVTCSSGNHGRAVAYVAELLGIPATICLPEWIDPAKLEAIRNHGAETVLHGNTYDEAEIRSFEIRDERGLFYVHPFDDPHVIAGQGTIGLELVEQIPSLRTVIVPLSGGGLVSGVALAVKSHDPSIRVIGVSAERARVMYESLKEGKPIEFPEEETVANALSGGIGLNNQYTFRLVRDMVDEYVLVSEEEVMRAMALAAAEQNIIVEGGGAVGIAALLFDKVTAVDGDAAVVVSGGNVDLETFAWVLSMTISS